VFLSVSAQYATPGFWHPDVSHQVTAVFLCDCYPQYQHQSQCTIRHCGRLKLTVLRWSVGQHSLFLIPLALLSGTWGFLLSLNHDWFTCQLQRAEFLRKGSHKGPFFRIFPLSLQFIISNQMRPWRLRGAWFSRLLRHPARRQSGSILSPGTHTGFPLPIGRQDLRLIRRFVHESQLHTGARSFSHFCKAQARDRLTDELQFINQKTIK